MAEFYMRHIVAKSPMATMVTVDSAAVSTEEIGNPIYPPARRTLDSHCIDYECKGARQMTRRDYDECDMIILMDQSNLRIATRLLGGDPQHKLSLLLHHAGIHRDVADPWYTGDFEQAWQDITLGCNALLKELCTTLHKEHIQP